MHLLCHAGYTTQTLLVGLVVFLRFYQLVGRFLCKKFNGYPLIVHGNLRLATNISPSHCITHAPRAVFIFLDIANQLITCLDVYLPSFYDFLEYLGIFTRQLLHLSLSNEVLPPLLLKLHLLRIVPVNVLFYRLSRVFCENFVQFLPVIVKGL